MAKILVVDDEIFILDLVKRILEQEGYVVFTAKNGTEGYTTTIKEHPDLIITDEKMPEMDGTTMALALRRNKEFKKLPIILMSADPPNNVSGLFQAVLPKPFDIIKLLAKVAFLLQT